ncbi:MAG TPA: glutamine--fructose-6-phosphate transaminase (isomerizing) [Solirubrobacteraceae bacterium]|nr:glutamine--fructose-6-phosphate transaminase (isomerizing) [Solirubrobacteraceae bacterium]
MCGIVGYVGRRAPQGLLLSALRRLEYRGYDSAGIAVTDGEQVELTRAVGNLDALQAKLEASRNGAGAPDGVLWAGIGHTRWATHGRVNEANAHPHFDSAGRFHVVVNGIVENYIDLRERLRAEGAVLRSETDAEVIAHLIGAHYSGDLVAAARATLQEIVGDCAFVAMSTTDPGRLVGARRQCPLIVGLGDGEQFIASAIPAFLSHTRRVIVIESEEVALLEEQGVRITAGDGQAVEREPEQVMLDQEAIEKGGFETFMLKEIYEQPDAVAETLSGHLRADGGIELELEGDLEEAQLAACGRVIIVGCGTSYHAGLVGRYLLEEWARLPVELDIASEWRYRNPVLGAHDLVIGISQSGETADTLAALREARARGAMVVALANVAGSQMTRDAQGTLFTRAGVEIGVAATKTFTCQVVVMQLLALRLAELRGTLEPERIRELSDELRRLPHRITEMLGSPDDRRHSDLRRAVAAIAERHWQEQFFLYIGRNVGLPIALEGALKLKEISYIATDAYAAGEMKHGPIALLDQSTPVVCVATDSPVLGKLIANMQEVRARGARVIAICSQGNESVREHADELVALPAVDPLLQPLLAVVPLQLLAYEIAARRGYNVDQPRNLAKTVTVE